MPPSPARLDAGQLNALFQKARMLQAQGHFEDAEAYLGKILSVFPSSFEARFLDALCKLHRNQLKKGIAGLEKAQRLRKDHPDVLYNLGKAHLLDGAPDQALACFRRLAAVQPDLALAHSATGNALCELLRYPEAEACFRRAIELDPLHAEVHNDLGNALNVLGRHKEAEAAYRAALALRPDLAEAHNGLGNTLTKLEHYEEALQSFGTAARLRPAYPEPHCGMGNVLIEMKRPFDSIEHFKSAIALDVRFAEAFFGWGNALNKLSEYKAARLCFRKALEIRPDYGHALIEYGSACILWGDYEEGIRSAERAIRKIPEADGYWSSLLFNLHYVPDLPASELARRHRAFGESVTRRVRPRSDPWPNERDPERRLRVGFLSGDFRRHSVGFFIANLIPALDGCRLERYAYANQRTNDNLTDAMRAHLEHWREVADLDDDALADQIRADGIDILIDLSGHTAHNRLLTLARKPAPVQVTYLGYPDGTGLEAVDYFLGDRWMFPEAEWPLYVEQPRWLPEVALCFTPPDAPVAVGPLPALANGHVTFGCLNKREKFNATVAACWSRILERVPGSRLLLQNTVYGSTRVADDILELFARHGIGPERLTLIGVLGWAEHLECYNRVDIALDPYPYNGTTTTVEGLWMGVPLVAIKGNHVVAHMGESILHGMGMSEWIADDENAYVELAARMAADLPALAATRATLRQRLLASPLCDAPRFARNLESTLRGIWRDWCNAGPRRE